eukprot:1623115-Amphidinium_carterae.4
MEQQMAEVRQQVLVLTEQNQSLHGRIQDLTRELSTVRGGPRTSTSLVDTRVIGKPDHFSGGSSWRDWSVVMRAYTQAQNPDLTELMNKAENTDDPVDNAVLSVEAKAASTQLYYILVMVCRESILTRVVNSGQGEGLRAWRVLVRFHEPTSATRRASLLMEVLNFDMSGEAQERLAAFDRCIMKYEGTSKAAVPDNLKVGIILKQMPESALRQHLILNLERWNTYERLRQEIENIARAQIASSGTPMPMDLGALQDTKGSKGKGKGRGKGGYGQPQKIGPCHICGKQGHLARDCWQNQNQNGGKAKGKGKQKGAGGKGKGKGKDNTGGASNEAKGKCWRCGQKGHHSIRTVVDP